MPGPRRLVLALVLLAALLVASCVAVDKTAPAPAPMPVEASIQQAAPPPPPPPPPACAPQPAKPGDLVQLAVNKNPKGRPHTNQQIAHLMANKNGVRWFCPTDEIKIDFGLNPALPQPTCQQIAGPNPGYECVSQTFCVPAGECELVVKYTVIFPQTGEEEDPVLIIRP